MDNVWTVLAALVVLVGTIVNSRESRKAAKQLRPNGGSTVADAVNRIDKRLERVEDRLDRHIDGRKDRD